MVGALAGLNLIKGGLANPFVTTVLGGITKGALTVYVCSKLLGGILTDGI